MLWREIWAFAFANSIETIYVVDHLKNCSLSVLPLGRLSQILIPHPVEPGEYAHGVEGLVDALFGDTVYVGADGGDLGRLAGEAAHDGEDGRSRVLGALAVDGRALRAHEDCRTGEAAEDRHRVVGVAQEEAAFLQLQELLTYRLGERAVGGVGELLVADAPVEARRRVADDLVVNLAAELLGPEEGELEVAPAGGDVHEGIFEGGGSGA